MSLTGGVVDWKPRSLAQFSIEWKRRAGDETHIAWGRRTEFRQDTTQERMYEKSTRDVEAV